MIWSWGNAYFSFWVVVDVKYKKGVIIIVSLPAVTGHGELYNLKNFIIVIF